MLIRQLTSGAAVAKVAARGVAAIAWGVQGGCDRGSRSLHRLLLPSGLLSPARTYHVFIMHTSPSADRFLARPLRTFLRPK